MAISHEPIVQLIEQFGAEGVKGSGLVVAKHGEVVFDCFSGEAKPGRPASASTIWPLASISKLYAAAAAMSCLERGEIALSTKAGMLFPDFTGGGKEKINLRHLLTHTSGLPYESTKMAERLASKWTLEQLVFESIREDLLYAPGLGQSYSDYGIGLAGLMCAKAAGMTFPELVRTRVLEPAGLNDTFMPPTAEVKNRIAYVDGVLAEGTEGAMYNSDHARQLAHPAFGAIASTHDLLKFGLLFDPNRSTHLFSEAATRTMITNQIAWPFPDHPLAQRQYAVPGWGIGFHVKGEMDYPELASPQAFGHPGASGCLLVVDPVWDVAFAFTSNLHLNLGYDAWWDRLMRISNVVMACMTRSG
jgi:CubicO group peptidase (beta-lactamase class C family)